MVVRKLIFGAVRVGLASCALAMCAMAGLGQERTEQLLGGSFAAATAESTATNLRNELAEAPTSSASQDIEISWKTLPKRILHDQKDIWLFPLQLAKGRYLAPTLAVTGVSAALIVADPHAMPYFRTHSGNLDDFNDVFDGPITSAAIGIVPVTFLLVGQVRHDPYASKTALLAGEAYANSAIVDLAIKAITRRKRPSDVAPGQPFNDTFFSGGKSPFKGSSFPSGHAAGAFAVATIVARRYGHHRWVPWVAYGCATAISLSRVTTRAHFPSDVFVGAALGYSIARFEVLRH